MSIVASEVGIDVSKSDLVASIDQRRAVVYANTPEGAALVCRELPAGSTVHMESSGGYERTVERALRASGLDVRVHNPLKARRLSEGIGPTAKTDAIDARKLSSTGKLLP